MEKWWIPFLNKEICKVRIGGPVMPGKKKKGIVESSQKYLGANLNGLSLTKDGAI